MVQFIHSPLVRIVITVVSALLMWLLHSIFRLYREDVSSRNWRSLEIDAKDFGVFRYSSLALVSLLSLFLEMMMIRWVSSEISVFAYFKNLILVACFLGFGLGCYLQERRIQLLALIAPLLTLSLLLKDSVSPIRAVFISLPTLIGRGTEVHFWGVPAMPASWSAMLLALVVMVPLFAVVAMMFVPFGQMVGRYLEHGGHGVMAYTVNVLASTAGIALYTLLCFTGQPPAVWMLVAGALSVLVFWRKRAARWILCGCFLASLLILSIRDHPTGQTYWSPYQKLVLLPRYERGEIAKYALYTNGSWYQELVNLSSEFVRSHPDDFPTGSAEWLAYNLPYKFYPAPRSVLVLGSGTGNDVAAALRNGAERVVAVEIDPLILKLGRQLHFERPYQSPRVQVVLDDARSYIQNSNEQFDLIVFSLLDSHTTASHFSNIRTDNFVYTREALERARHLLKPDGLFILKFFMENAWIPGRVLELMRTTFGADPIQLQLHSSTYDTGGRFYIAGSTQKINQAMTNPQLASFVKDNPGPQTQSARMTTDDWPYFYQHEPGVPMSVILVSGGVLLTFGWFLLQTGSPGSGGRVDLHFLFLGAGFMLLEVQTVSRFALLFGTTWIVNSIVVSGVMCFIVAANLLYQRYPRIPVSWVYAGLFASLLMSAVVPMESLFVKSIVLRAVVSTLVFCLPVFFAGVVFVSSFARENFRGSALGSNLFGALAGGLLESLSLWFGLKSLVLLAGVFYLASAMVRVRSLNVPPAVANPTEVATR